MGGFVDLWRSASVRRFAAFVYLIWKPWERTLERVLLVDWKAVSKVNKGVNIMGIFVPWDPKCMICGMATIPFALTLTEASIRKWNFEVFLSILMSPPHWLPMISKVLVHQESKGKPLIEIHPRNWKISVTMVLTDRWYLLRYIIVIGVLITQILMAVRVSIVKLQTNKARPSMKGATWG